MDNADQSETYLPQQYQRFNNDIIWVCVVLTIIIVQLIQEFGMILARKTDKRINK